MMITWNYRVVRRTQGGEEEYRIHEVYYNENEKIDAWSTNPVGPSGGTVDELAADLWLMTEAINKPVLDYSDLPPQPTDGAWADELCL